MKNITFLVVASMLLISASCKNDDDHLTPLEQLPPPTQTGKNTFGCLLDGEAFLPGPGPNTLDCVYQLVDGGYYFTLQANKTDSNNNLIGLGCNTEKLEIQEGITYQLSEKAEGNAYGRYFYFINQSFTTNMQTGEMTITKLDFTNHIVSGTFWYDVVDSNGIIHNIREGRFDVRFTQ